MGFQQALSGLNAASRNLDVIGNNIANANTVGSKSSRAEFQDMYAASFSGGGSGSVNVGIGVNPGVVAQQFTQGNITSTGNPLDLAINGGGFFELTDGQNPAVYSRNGQFKVDTNGFIVNNSNLKLLGYSADTTGTIVPGIATPLQLPTSGIAPVATSGMTLELNTDSRVGRPSGMPTVTPQVDGTSTPATISTAALGGLDFATSNASITVDGTAITLNQNAAGSLTTLASQLTTKLQASALGANYSASVNSSGKLVITHASSLTAVAISAPDANATTAGFTATAGVAGTATTAVAPAAERVNTANPATYNNATSTTVYDVKGQPVTLTYYFQKVGADKYNVYATANGKSLTGVTGESTTAMRPIATINYPNTGGNPTTAGGGSIDSYAWSSGGVATTTAITDGIITLPSIPSVTLSSGGASEIIPSFKANLSTVTEYGAAFGVTNLSVNGNAPGALTSVNIGTDGVLLTRYSNGQTKVAGKIELATFRNAQGLQPLGGNAWAQSSSSGSPIVNTPGQGNLGVLQAGAVEESNVDLTAELVNMMTAQRSYQANAQTIKTQDQVMSTLVNLR